MLVSPVLRGYARVIASARLHNNEYNAAKKKIYIFYHHHPLLLYFCHFWQSFGMARVSVTLDIYKRGTKYCARYRVVKKLCTRWTIILCASSAIITTSPLLCCCRLPALTQHTHPATTTFMQLYHITLYAWLFIVIMFYFDFYVAAQDGFR